MNRIALALVLATAAAGNAFADDITVDTTPFRSSVTHAQVQAELAQFRQSGVNPWSQAYNPLKAFRGQRTRAEVAAEYLRARDTVQAMTAEDSGSSHLARQDRADAPTLAGVPVNAQ